MDSIRANGEGNVDAVVDDERDIVLAGDLQEAGCLPEHFCLVAISCFGTGLW